MSGRDLGEALVGAADHDVTVIRSRSYLRGLLGLPGTPVVIYGVAHLAVTRAHIEPRCRTFTDTDSRLDVRGGTLAGTPHPLVDADIPAGRVRHRGTAYTADRDMTVRGIQAQLAGQLADTGLTAGNPDDRRAIDLADPHEPGA